MWQSILFFMTRREIYNPVGLQTWLRFKQRIGNIISEQSWKYPTGIHRAVWIIVTAVNNSITLFLKFGWDPFHARDEFHIRKYFFLKLVKRIHPNCCYEEAFSNVFCSERYKWVSSPLLGQYRIFFVSAPDTVVTLRVLTLFFTANFRCRLWQYRLCPMNSWAQISTSYLKTLSWHLKYLLIVLSDLACLPFWEDEITCVARFPVF